MEIAGERRVVLTVYEQVRCLECGEAYSKPFGGGTVDRNPGCPSCAYVGWIPLTRPPERGLLRSAGGPPPLHFARPR
jgi:hypothetical protein